jgi:hypothetical protein
VGREKAHCVFQQALESEGRFASHTPYAERVGILEALLVGDLRLEGEELLLSDLAASRRGVSCGIKTYGM